MTGKYNLRGRQRLKEDIRILEEKQSEEWPLLKSHLHLAAEKLKPSNLIKNTFREVVSGGNFKKNILVSLAGLAAGEISARMLTGKSTNPFLKIAGMVLQAGVSMLVSNNPEALKKLSETILGVFQNKPGDPDPGESARD